MSRHSLGSFKGSISNCFQVGPNFAALLNIHSGMHGIYVTLVVFVELRRAISISETSEENVLSISGICFLLPSLWLPGRGFLSKENRSATLRQLAQSHCLPFVNAVPWLVDSDADNASAAAFLRSYLEIVDPFITITYGEKVSLPAFGLFSALLTLY
jgi:hypothetical protein